MKIGDLDVKRVERKALDSGEAHYEKQLPKHIYVKELR